MHSLLCAIKNSPAIREMRIVPLHILVRAHDAWRNYVSSISSRHNSLTVSFRKMWKHQPDVNATRETEVKSGDGGSFPLFAQSQSGGKIRSLLPIKRYKFPRIINPFLARMNTISKWNCAHKYTQPEERSPLQLRFPQMQRDFSQSLSPWIFLLPVCFYYALDRMEI